MRRRDPKELFDAATGGDRLAVARLISLVEEGGAAAREVGRLTFPRTGNAYTVGITGAPGAGKSTLTDGLIGEVRSAGDEVGVLAVDPSSPFSGGAFLGDRVRIRPGEVIENCVVVRNEIVAGKKRPARALTGETRGENFVVSLSQ